MANVTRMSVLPYIFHTGGWVHAQPSRLQQQINLAALRSVVSEIRASAKSVQQHREENQTAR